MGAYMGVPSAPRINIPGGATAAAWADSSSVWVREVLLPLLFLPMDFDWACFSVLAGRPPLRRPSLFFTSGPRVFPCVWSDRLLRSRASSSDWLILTLALPIICARRIRSTAFCTNISSLSRGLSCSALLLLSSCCSASSSED